MLLASILAIAGENGTTVTPDRGWVVLPVVIVALAVFALAGEIAGRRGR